METRYRSNRIAPQRRGLSRLNGAVVTPQAERRAADALARAETARTVPAPEGQAYCPACHQPMRITVKLQIQGHKNPGVKVRGYNQCIGSGTSVTG